MIPGQVSCPEPSFLSCEIPGYEACPGIPHCRMRNLSSLVRYPRMRKLSQDKMVHPRLCVGHGQMSGFQMDAWPAAPPLAQPDPALQPSHLDQHTCLPGPGTVPCC